MSLKVGKTFSQNSLNIIKRMKDAGIFCDALLKSRDGEEFPVHKCIMAAYSYYFEILFINTMVREERQVFQLKDIDKEILQCIIDYIYCGKIELNTENVRKIFHAANEYLLSELMNECCSYMIDHLNAKNCISIKNTGKTYGNIILEQSAHQYLMKYFAEVSKQNEELMHVTVEELANILNCAELNVKEEELVWDTALRWIDINPQERKKHMPALLKCIRLGLLDSDFFMRTVRKHPYVTENEDCYPLIMETLEFLNDLDTISQRSEEILTPDLVRPRIPHEIIFAVGGWSSGSPTDYIETYDSRADRWVKMTDVDPAGPRAYHRCAVIDHTIYIIGGFDGMNHYSGCRCLDTINKKWKEIAPMHCKRCYVSVAVLDNLIYAMGGYNGAQRHNTAERYDYRTNQWTMIAPMHMQRSDADATTLDGFIYIIGGFTGQHCLESAERYNPQTNQWTLISNMRSQRSGLCCIAFKDCVYTLGGFNGFERLKTVEKYNPHYNTWSDVPDMITTRSNFAVEVIDDMIFAIGGYNGESIICQVECYSEATSQWYEATDMNIFRSALAACIIKNIPNTTDYIHKHRDKLLEEKRQRLRELREMETEMDHRIKRSTRKMSLKVGKTFSQNSLNIIKRMKDAGIFCDALLKSRDGEEFPVHKCIMAAYSYYFEILFINTMVREERQVFQLKDIDKEILQCIIDYIYCGKIELNTENVRKIFHAANEYLLSELMNECCSYMIDHLNAKNCISIKNTGKTYGNIILEQSAHQYLMKYFAEVSKQNEELMHVTVEELANILNCAELNVKEEELVWDTALRWIDINPQERKKHMPALLKCIRLGLLDSDFFMRTVRKHPYVTENEDCYPLIMETLEFLNDLDTISQRSEEILTPDLVRPRIPHEIIFAVGGWSSGSPTDYIETYDSRADRWVKMTDVDPAGPRAYHRCAVIDHTIYIIGGFDGMNHYSGCRCLDTINKKWKEIAPMHCKRCYVSVAVLDNLIYAMGGYNGAQRHNTAERYDYRTNQWTMIAPMHMQRSDADATTLDGFIYIIGGFTGQHCLESAERYNPQTNQWTLISNMRSQRSGLCCIAFKDCVYTLGGFNGFERLKTVEKYNPHYNTWSDVPDMITTRSNFAVEVIDDMIFAIGGYNGESIICQVECYSEATSQWYEATDMNIFRSALAACIIKNIPNTTDYIHKHRDKLLEEKRQRLRELREMETEMD
ncbi:uncharacterized protein LOC111619637 [Centruroides sculpturatus]|uniref:uncharacterized protein LOC111619637 n=1 Tax=Centruroides sculpturatus TaxID=218467 RepID=UPI000C6DA702|nr:uncharacterized protein LOC111619637 [Centruroides sculpturatus]